MYDSFHLRYPLQGFAFINFVHREDAARAIQSVQRSSHLKCGMSQVSGHQFY